MNENFEKLERELDREIARLRIPLDADTPAPSLIARVQQAVTDEALRRRRRKYRLLAMRTMLSTAAALLLVLYLAWPNRLHRTAAPPAAEASFSDWVAALDETDSRFAALLDTNWFLESSDMDGDSGNSEGVFDSLDESFRSFESIIGT